MKRNFIYILFFLVGCKEQKTGELDFNSLLFFLSVIASVFFIIKFILNRNKKILLLPFAVSIALLIYSRIENDKTEYIILPKDYNGNVRFIYEQKCGVNGISIDNNINEYNIPSNGVFITSDPHQCNPNSRRFFYKINEELIEIEHMDKYAFRGNWSSDTSNYQNPERFRVGVYMLSCGYKPDFGYNMQEAYIGSYNSMIDSLNKTTFHTRWSELVKEELDKCK